MGAHLIVGVVLPTAALMMVAFFPAPWIVEVWNRWEDEVLGVGSRRDPNQVARRGRREGRPDRQKRRSERSVSSTGSPSINIPRPRGQRRDGPREARYLGLQGVEGRVHLGHDNRPRGRDRGAVADLWRRDAREARKGAVRVLFDPPSACGDGGSWRGLGGPPYDPRTVALQVLIRPPEPPLREA